MQIGEKLKRVFNPKRFNRPVELPKKEPEKEREKVPVRREKEEAQDLRHGS